MKKLAVGSRYLLRRLWSDSYEEHTVEELSPSKKRFKSAGSWLNVDDYLISESELLPAKPAAPTADDVTQDKP
jgi:hypothetical protein